VDHGPKGMMRNLKTKSRVQDAALLVLDFILITKNAAKIGVCGAYAPHTPIFAFLFKLRIMSIGYHQIYRGTQRSISNCTINSYYAIGTNSF
jgi:hypothetical protein